MSFRSPSPGTPRVLAVGAALALGVALISSASFGADAARPSEPPVTSTEAPSTVESDAGPAVDWAEEKEFWSFRPPQRQPPPPVRDRAWPRQPLDDFVLARIEARGLSPSKPADARTLLRRVTYDLTGLPPTPDAARRFLEDEAPDAYARLVDRLLSSPQFGERLASFWLPLARYGEDQAHQVGSDTTMFYPNAYRYRDWVIDAFNRDLPYDDFLRLQLAADRLGAGAADLPALGFLGVGPKYYNRNRIEVLADEWEDRVDTVTRTMLGLTVACARCHNHKFDPIPTRDYYALAGVFASTRMVNKTPDGKVIEGKVSADKMPADTLHIVEDGEVKDLNVFIRGQPDRKGPLAERGFLTVLAGEGEAQELFKEGSGRRELAEAIASPRNPLTARVMVNRLWGFYFGQPLAPTPSNLGHSGLPPSHPELLDDLAVRFMEGGWSVRSLVREFVLSATYRQDSHCRPETAEADPENALLSHMPRRRLSVEQWRDSALFFSGELEEADHKSRELDDPLDRRRTVYGRVSRLKLNDLLMQFDYPDANVHAEGRSVTTTATQKLFLLNDPFVLDRAQAFARRIRAAGDAGDSALVRKAFQLVYARDPVAEELGPILAFLGEPGGSPESRNFTRWDEFAQVLLTSNEMLYVD